MMPRKSLRGARWGVLALLLALGLPLSARAEEMNRIRAEVAELEQQAQGLNIRFAPKARSGEELAEHRLVDAQVLYTLKDYTRAAILLFDYISKYKNSRGYPDAVFYLADSLYHKRDYLSARRYFSLIVNQIKGKYYQESLQRLVELSLRTSDSSGVDEYLRALATIPKSSLNPSVPYVWGKYYYFKKNYEQALAGFKGIDQGNKYYMHAQYFIGAVQVQQNDLAGAMQTYQALLRTTPKTKSEKHIRDLTYLALGRLLYEKNKIEDAIKMYQKVSRRSEEFDASLYEICWAYIKAKEYPKALRALDLLVLAQPDSPFIPQVRVLQGNLLIRLEKWGRATSLFTSTREKFLPIQNRMKQLMTEHNDPNVFFDALLIRNVHSMGVVIQVPKLAMHWVKEDPKVKRALNLVMDLREIQVNIKESEALIKRLERAINTPAKIKIFPEFAAAKSSALEVDNRMLLARQAILKRQKDLFLKVASAVDKDQLYNLSAKRGDLEKKVQELPTSVDGYTQRERTNTGRLVTLEKDISRLAIVVESLTAQMVAAEKFFVDTQGAKNQAVKDSFLKEIQEIRQVIDGLQSDVSDMRQDLAEAKSMIGVGGPQEVEERGVKLRYRDALAEEHKFLLGFRGRLASEDGAEFDELSTLLRRCDTVDGLLENFDKQLDSGVEEKLADIRKALVEEKQFLAQYQRESTDFKSQTDNVAGTITYDGFREVGKRFYEIVVRADVGIIDVSWALKDNKSKEVSRLVRQQKMDLKVLDEEFKEVLQKD